MSVVVLRFPILLSVAAALVAPSAGCDRAVPDAAAQTSPKGAADAKPTPVTLVAIERGGIARPIRIGGILKQKSELDLAFTVGGVLSRLHVDAGAHVRRGQLLAELDATEVGAAVAQAKASVEKAERDLSRVKSLHGTGALPLAEMQNAETGAAVARAQLASADFAARHAVITSPDDGVIDARLVEKGEVLAPGRAVLRLSGRSKGTVVKVALADKDALGLTIGQPAEVTIDAAPEARLPARISTLATVASPQTGTFAVEVKLDAPPEQLLSGMTVKVSIPRSVRVGASVPLVSLVGADGKHAFVYVVESGRARRMPVEVAFLAGDRAALATRLDGIERVVGSGAALLEDGAAVDVRP